jgi:translation initiation factor 1
MAMPPPRFAVSLIRQSTEIEVDCPELSVFRAKLTCRAVHVMTKSNARLVYSTSGGRMCPACGWPMDDCRCSRTTANESIPSRIVAKLRLEKKGRGGKAVTVVYDLPRNTAFLKEWCQELKRACGTGGAIAENTIELQGDQRERIRGLLEEKGIAVKG